MSNGNLFNGACYFCRHSVHSRVSLVFVRVSLTVTGFVVADHSPSGMPARFTPAPEVLVRAYLYIRSCPSGTMLSVIH